jgi:hypothetical protein
MMKIVVVLPLSVQCFAHEEQPSRFLPSCNGLMPTYLTHESPRGRRMNQLLTRLGQPRGEKERLSRSLAEGAGILGKWQRIKCKNGTPIPW